MFEVRVCKRKRCLRNFCRRVGVVRPHAYPTQRVQCRHHVGQSQWLKVKTSKSHLSYDDASYTLAGELQQLSLHQLRNWAVIHAKIIKPCYAVTLS